MGIGDKIKEFIIQPDEEEELELTQEEAAVLSQYEKPQVEGVSSITADTNIVLFEPRKYDEGAEIGMHIKAKKACCVNLHRMPNEQRQRIIDFLSGVVFGLDGTVKKIGDNVILCSPRNLTVGGEINLNGVDVD